MWYIRRAKSIDSYNQFNNLLHVPVIVLLSPGFTWGESHNVKIPLCRESVRNLKKTVQIDNYGTMERRRLSPDTFGVILKGHKGYWSGKQRFRGRQGAVGGRHCMVGAPFAPWTCISDIFI